jgi:hypothetical protein
MASSVRRENVPVTETELSLLDRLAQPDSPERAALAELLREQPGTSRAQLAHAVLALGVQAVRAKVQEAGYAALAASYTEDELDQRRAETASRRERAHQRYSGE